MAVSNISPFQQPQFTSSTLEFASVPAINSDMDMDMDVDLGADEEISALEAEAMRVETQAIHPPESASITTNDICSSTLAGDTSTQLMPHKVHIRGVDNLSTAHIHAFASEHYPFSEPTRIEWIDDTSANIVYDTPAAALQALNSFSYVSNEGPSSLSTLQLRSAKSLSSHPDSQLNVRLAVFTDKKQPGARERSRYYLFNPDQDPGERRRRDHGRGGRRRFDNEDDGGYRRRRYDDHEQRRRTIEDEECTFDSSLYDDDPATVAARDGHWPNRRRNSHSSRSSNDDRRRDRRVVRFSSKPTKELFPERVSRGSRLRDRSASPARDLDGDEAMGNLHDESASARRKHRQRSYTPPPRGFGSGETLGSFRVQNGAKELFPSKLNGNNCGAGTSTSTMTQKELFPTKLKATTSLHRRSAAFDAADETADLFAGRMTVPFVDGAGDDRLRSRNLADRISRNPPARNRRLEDRISLPTATSAASTSAIADDDEDEMSTNPGFSIRGAAAAKMQSSDQQGFSIRGAASAKELFPEKFGGGGNTKELFPEKLDGRGGRRRRAEDMFH